jgi:hypothetical protein
MPDVVWMVLDLLQLITAIIFPLGVLVILWLARRDLHNWVTHIVDKGKSDRRLEGDVKEFME